MLTSWTELLLNAGYGIEVSEFSELPTTSCRVDFCASIGTVVFVG